MYLQAIVFLLVTCVILHAYTWTHVRTYSDAAFRRFQTTYLVVYGLAVTADWLQGPYVYALYELYGIGKHDIEFLFVVGFASSMVFGTFVGGVADKSGRRLNCILYGVLYGASCITKHFNIFNVLLIGRLFAGIATSILYSAFESWLVCEHSRRGYPADQLSNTFAFASLLNSVTAILAGFIAQGAVDVTGGWYVAAFDVALLVLFIMVTLVYTTWSENHGDSDAQVSASFVRAFEHLRSDARITLLAAMQSVFEGAMYIFVLEWTPALEQAAAAVLAGEEEVVKTVGELIEEGMSAERQTIPHGFVFAAFMICAMIGAGLFRLANRFSVPESYMLVVFAVSAVSFVPALLTPHSPLAVFAGFCLFETCVGVFWPSFGMLRSKYIPEEARATLMNFFRVPLNLIVVVVLLQDLSVKTLFLCCALLLALAVALQLVFYLITRRSRFELKAVRPEVPNQSPLIAALQEDVSI